MALPKEFDTTQHFRFNLSRKITRSYKSGIKAVKQQFHLVPFTQ